jgi:hypothetical protein
VASVAANISFVTYCAMYKCIGRNAASKSPMNAARIGSKSRRPKKIKTNCAMPKSAPSQRSKDIDS